ncbi:MAG TPA: sugar ABC transporter permease [Kofleriaceae bacterium]|jgi:trehalose/maltose transport system permease protein|nr:sugar ABC transporter permease [Kofleriaceae bacterium]
MRDTSWLAASRTRSAWLFLAPMLVLLALVAGWPLIRTIWLGFTDANTLQIGDAKGVGFDNFLVHRDGHWYGVLADPVWWRAVKNTLVFTVFSVGIETLLGLGVALVLNRAFPGRGVVRAAILIPWAIPTVVSAKIWGWLLNDQYGFINHVLMSIGLVDHPIAWTADPSMLMTSVILVDVWKTTPFMALLILAALQMLPKECYEAALIDGTHPIKVFWRVTLPLIRPALMVAVIFRAIDALRVFDVIYVLTGANERSMTMSIYARQQLFEFNQAGYGSAVSTLLFFLIALATILLLVATRVRLTED